MGDRQAFLQRIEEIDGAMNRLFQVMQTRRWFAKAFLAQVCKTSTHAVSARMSDLRDGGAEIEKKYVGGGVYLYRMVRW